MHTAHREPEDWRTAVERLRAESASVLREMFSGHRPLEASEGPAAFLRIDAADRRRAD